LIHQADEESVDDHSTSDDSIDVPGQQSSNESGEDKEAKHVEEDDGVDVIPPELTGL
jgi:hypothetical protein